jgi:UDP-N-acetylglucosamine:LPS N-acetylglucosamine transferase
MKKKLCMIASSGGHYEELSQLKVLEETYDLFWVTEKTEYLQKADYYLTPTGSNDWKLIFKIFGIVSHTLHFWRKEKPDAVVTTGALIAVPVCLIAKLCKKKVIYIETFARVRDGARASKFMYKIADLFIYQWESLQEIYPKGVFGGSIY